MKESHIAPVVMLSLISKYLNIPIMRPWSVLYRAYVPLSPCISMLYTHHTTQAIQLWEDVVCKFSSVVVVIMTKFAL